MVRTKISHQSATIVTPFERGKLNALMGGAGLDLVLATTRFNTRYLTGGYYNHQWERSNHWAVDPYMPYVGVPRTRVGDAFFISGWPLERADIQEQNLWISHVEVTDGTVVALDRYGPQPSANQNVALTVAERIRAIGLEKSTIGVEMPFLPADALLELQRLLPKSVFVDASLVLEDLRSVKSAHEVELLRIVHDRVTDSIHAAFAIGRPGITTSDIAARLHIEMAMRGVDFLRAFVAAGPSLRRSPSTETWEVGHLMHIDCGGDYRGYQADMCRMASLGTPSPLAQKVYQACVAVQDEVRSQLRAGITYADVKLIGERAVGQSGFGEYGQFFAHGIGMGHHEAPRLLGQNQLLLLKVGHAISVEADFIHPEVGHVKIEDAVVITPLGCEGLGDRGRELLIVGARESSPGFN
jgi:Xaa-Pro dipeptidase